MSEAIITRRGGGSLSANSAVIHVSAPVGSAVTFAKDGVVAKVIPASKAHTNSTTPIYAGQARYADYYYTVSPSNYGTWTMTATDGSQAVARSVSVGSNMQYDVELPYDLYLVRNGVVQSGFTLNKAGDNNYSVTYRDGYIRLYVSDWYNYCKVWFFPITSVRDYKYVAFDGQARGAGEQNNAFGLVTDAKSGSTQTSMTWAAKTLTVTASRTTLTTRSLQKCDISSLTGNYYVGVQSYSHNNQGTSVPAYPGEAYIYNLYLTNDPPST